MRPFLLLIFFSATQFTLSAQTLERKSLNEKLREIDTAKKFKPDESVYVINGIMFTQADSTKIDSILNVHDVKYLISLDFLTCATTNLVPCYKPIILVRFAYNQTPKRKKTLWRKVKHAFNDNYASSSQHIFNDARDPVLYIDNELIHHTEAKKRLKALSKSDIYYIDYADKPVSAELYGQNARNWLIRIWTFPK